MAALSGGHLATDFASGSVPALLPFFAAKFDLSYTLTAVLMLAVLVSSSLTQPLFGLWSDRRGALWLLPAGLALAGAGIGLAAVAPSYGAPGRARLPLGARHRGLPSRGREVRGLRERAQARERDVALQHRRQHRLRARPDHRHPARPLARPRAGRAARRRSPSSSASLAVLAALPYLSRLRPARGGPGSARRRGGRRAGDGHPRRRDRASQRRLVRAAHLRAALGRVARQLGGRRQPPAVADAPLRGGGNAAARADRGPVRAPADAARRPGAADADDPRLRARRRPRRRARADGGRHLRRRHVRAHDGAEPDVPAAARRDGVRALDRPRDGPRRASRPSRSAGSPTRSTCETALVCSAFAPLLGVVLCLFLPAPRRRRRLRPPRPPHTLCSTDRSTNRQGDPDDRAGVLRRASLEGRPGEDRGDEQQLRLRHRRRRRLDGDRRRRCRVGRRGRARGRLHDLRERGDADEDRERRGERRRPPT